MSRLLDRSIGSIADRLLLLAPPDTAIPEFFNRCEFDAARHRSIVRDVQRLRGSVYLEDGALDSRQLSADGLHLTPEDERSWHLVATDSRGRVSGCTWYREHDNTVYLHRLRLRNCPLARTDEWRDRLWKAVEREIADSRRDGLRYAEVGGWAVSAESRCRSEGLVLALAAYSLGRICGGAIGITTATVRHGSSSILCRIGGRPLQVDGWTMPPYYDDQYRCVMEILRFDSREPSVRFRPLVDRLHERLADVPVIARPYWPLIRTLTAPTQPRIELSSRFASSASGNAGLSLSA